MPSIKLFVCIYGVQFLFVVLANVVALLPFFWWLQVAKLKFEPVVMRMDLIDGTVVNDFFPFQCCIDGTMGQGVGWIGFG